MGGRSIGDCRLASKSILQVSYTDNQIAPSYPARSSIFCSTRSIPGYASIDNVEEDARTGHPWPVAGSCPSLFPSSSRRYARFTRSSGRHTATNPALPTSPFATAKHPPALAAIQTDDFGPASRLSGDMQDPTLKSTASPSLTTLLGEENYLRQGPWYPGKAGGCSGL